MAEHSVSRSAGLTIEPHAGAGMRLVYPICDAKNTVKTKV